MANEVAVRFNSEAGLVKVTTTLYGKVSEARLDREYQIGRYRAEQLGMSWPRPAKKFIPRSDRRAMGLGADNGGERYDNIDWEG